MENTYSSKQDCFRQSQIMIRTFLGDDAEKPNQGFVLRCNLTEPSPKSVPLFCRSDITLNLGRHVPCRPSSIQLDENRVVRAPGYRHLTASMEAGNDTNKGIVGGLCSRFEWSTQYRNALSIRLVMKCTLFCERGKKRGKSLRLSEHFSTFSFGNAQKSFNKS